MDKPDFCPKCGLKKITTAIRADGVKLFVCASCGWSNRQDNMQPTQKASEGKGTKVRLED